MERISQIVIRNCYDCPYITISGCGKTNKPWTGELISIIANDTPDWCPLPERNDDAEQP